MCFILGGGLAAADDLARWWFSAELRVKETDDSWIVFASSWIELVVEDLEGLGSAPPGRQFHYKMTLTFHRTETSWSTCLRVDDDDEGRVRNSMYILQCWTSHLCPCAIYITTLATLRLKVPSRLADFIMRPSIETHYTSCASVRPSVRLSVCPSVTY